MIFLIISEHLTRDDCNGRGRSIGAADLETGNLPVYEHQTAVVRNRGKGVGAIAWHGNVTAEHQGDIRWPACEVYIKIGGDALFGQLSRLRSGHPLPFSF